MSSDVATKAAELTRMEKVARVALAALIDSRSLSVREDDAAYPIVVAALAWKIADAMNAERGKRARNRRSVRNG